MTAPWLPSSRNDGRLAAVLGPTNTGKTHYAIERMLAYKSGVIGFPLRLLAREVYDKVVAQKGAQAAALVTGEEKIIPASARYFICTVEAMPTEREAEFLAVDEIQLAADPDRGHVFTSRLLHARGVHETLFLGSDTMRPLLQRLLPGVEFVSRTRFSTLSYAGPKKLSRLPRRSAVVAFSADNVYAIAELMRRQRGGAAVVMGALSPRTRNAQVGLYQAGDVDFLVATDAIGMGLNMEIDHVAFSGSRKYDGRRRRDLTPAEVGQIAGRAGRHMNDGTFGVTSDCPPFETEVIEQVENHEFDPVKGLYWRNEALDFAHPAALFRALEKAPGRPELARARDADDVHALRRLLEEPDIKAIAAGGAALKRLWEVCQIPDFRKTGHDSHARILADVYLHLMGPEGRLKEEWLAGHVEPLDRVDGDVDSLAARIAHVRTWTFVSNRTAWTPNARYWQGRTREIEDKLSDALHEKLMQRFVDRRTSVLMRKLKDDAPLLAGISGDGEVTVEGEFVGRLLGFQFIADAKAVGPHGKAVRAAALKALTPEMAARAAALAGGKTADFELKPSGEIRWRSAVVARLVKGPMPLRPDLELVAGDMLTAPARARVAERLQRFVGDKIEGLLGPLLALQKATTQTQGEDVIEGPARGLGFRLVEHFGAMSRMTIQDDVKGLEQEERGKLRKLGVRFGEYSVYMPALLKPAPARLLILLWALSEGKTPGDFAPPPAGHVSTPNDKDLPQAYYFAAGFRPSGVRAVRIDMLERLADLIREAKKGVDMREGFAATPQMMSLVGCSGEEFESILVSLGLRKNVVKRQPAQEAEAKPAADASAATKAAAEPEEIDIDPRFAEAAALADAIGLPAATASPPPQADPAPGQEDQPQHRDSAPASGPEAPGAVETTDAPDASVEDAAKEPQAEEIEVVLWRHAPRKPRQDFRDRRPQRDAKGGDSAQRHAKNPNKGKGKGKRGPQNRDERPQRQNRPPRKEKPMDPNSPFAVLAALKADMGGDDAKKQDADENTPEKTS